MLRRNSACDTEDRKTRTHMGEVELRKPKGFHGCLSLCQPPWDWWLPERAGTCQHRQLAGADKITAQLQPIANKGSSRQETTCTRAQGPTVMPATSLLLPNCKQLLMWPSLTQNHTWNGILGKVIPATQMTRCTTSAASSSEHPAATSPRRLLRIYRLRT